MYSITKEITFEAAHVLPNHDGKCARLHGHSWRAWITVEAPNLIDHGPQSGMVLDFGKIKAETESMLIDYLDHHNLNETTGLADPTSESIARWIYGYLRDRLERWTVTLASVEVAETCTCRARYTP